jgi:serine/threonine protein kinase
MTTQRPLARVPSEQLESGVRIGDFEIEKRLGAGGMGIVYQARQVSLNRRVALKVLGPSLTQGSDLTRFQREAQAVARLKHPGIAALHFIGQDADLCYHVMELIEGVSLRRVIDCLAETQEAQSGPDGVAAAAMTMPSQAPSLRFDQPTTEEVNTAPPDRQTELSAAARQVRSAAPYVRRCCEIVRDAARALAYAHGEGVVHRDIKPENLMLDPKGRVHLIDFGLARFFDDVSITNTGQLIGTPLYMSPEQVTGRLKVDHRSDIYSLGLVLYEMLSLRRPIDFTSRENLLRNIVTKALPPLCCRNRSLPRALEAVVHKATSKDPEERYQTAEEMAAELDRFLEGKAVNAPPYRYRLDFQEIVASRPGGVVLASFVCFLAGMTLFTAITAVALMMLAISGMQLVSLVQVVVAVWCLAAGCVLGYGLLAGWSWARWVVVGLAVLMAVGCILAGFGLVAFALAANQMNFPAPDPADAAAANGSGAQPFSATRFMIGMVAMYSTPLLLAFVCAVATFIALIRRTTGIWFQMAARARKEHRETLLALGD